MTDVLDKIRKLLALSTSSNEHEAALAASMAAELMLKHQVDAAQLEDSAFVFEEECLENVKRLLPWRMMLLNGLAMSFGCRVTTDTTRDRAFKNGKAGRVLYRITVVGLVGRREAVAAARYMYAHFVAEVERLADVSLLARQRVARQRGVAPPRSLAYMNAFRLGAASVIFDRLKADRDARLGALRKSVAEDEALGRALVRLDQEALALKAHLRTLGYEPDESKTDIRARYSEGLGLADGQASGQEVDLGRRRDPLPAPPARLGKGEA